MAEQIRRLPFDQRMSPNLQDAVGPSTLAVLAGRTLKQEEAWSEMPAEPTPQSVYLGIYEGAVVVKPTADAAPDFSPAQDSILNLHALGRSTQQIANRLRLRGNIVQDKKSQIRGQLGAVSIEGLIIAGFRHRFWLPESELYGSSIPTSLAFRPVAPRLDYLAKRATKLTLDNGDYAALRLLAAGKDYRAVDKYLLEPRDHFRNVRLPLLMWRMGARTPPHLVRIAAEAQLITTRSSLEQTRSLAEGETTALGMLSLGYTPAEIATILDMTPKGVDSQLRRTYGALGVINRCHAVSAGHALGLFAPPMEL